MLAGDAEPASDHDVVAACDAVDATATDPAPEDDNAVVICPNTGNQKPAWACRKCLDRDGCPEWAAGE